MYRTVACCLIGVGVLALLLTGFGRGSHHSDASEPIRPDAGHPARTARVNAIKQGIAADLVLGQSGLFEAAADFARVHDRERDELSLCRAYRCKTYEEAICRMTIDWAVRQSVGVNTPPSRPGGDGRESDAAKAYRRGLEAELADHLCDHGRVELP